MKNLGGTNLNKEFLFELLNTCSPSGYEVEAVRLFKNYCKQFAKFEFTDSALNTCFTYGDGRIKFLLTAHIDENGFIIQNIDDSGYLHYIKVGGSDNKTIPGSRVSILLKDGRKLTGIIGKVPIHVEEDRDKGVLKPSDLKIDVGASSREEAEKMGIHIGDYVALYQDEPIDLGQYRFSSKGIDDKIGVFIIAEVLRQLSEEKWTPNNLTIYGVACSQEEVGCLGADIISHRIDPNWAIDFDVHFATDEDYVKANESGKISLGGGAMIEHGPAISLRFLDILNTVAENFSIKTQHYASKPGGTNLLSIKLGATDCQTAQLSIPNRYMHTQVETCDYRDIEYIISLTKETLKYIDALYDK